MLVAYVIVTVSKTASINFVRVKAPTNKFKKLYKMAYFCSTWVFKKFQAISERQTGKKLKCIRNDNCGEYIGPFDNYYKPQRIRH